MLRILRQAREDAGLSQRALARKLGVHASWVAKVELGERRLDVVEFIQVARALGRDPKRLFARVAMVAKT
jgi:transcriptional regulator with XRE-family HTH domain